MSAPTRVGSVVIDRQSHDVFALPTSAGRFVEQGDFLLTVEGAKTFKRGQYPLHQDLQPITKELTEIPFAMREQERRIEVTRSVLKTTLSRLIAIGFPTVKAA
jgi:hypothetical protein